MLTSLLISLTASAMVPVADLPSGASVPIGPPAPHLDLSLARQWQLSARGDWRAFQARYGGQMRWDPRDGTPHFWYGSGVSVDQSAALVADLARMAGVDPSELSLAHQVEHDGQPQRSLMRWDRTWRGAPVEGDQVLLVLVNGHVSGAWVRLTPVSLDASPRPGEIVLPVPSDAGRRTQPVLVRSKMDGSQRVFTDRQGVQRYRYETRYYATGQVSYQQRTTGDPMVNAPARHVTVTDSEGSEQITDDDGLHDLTGTVDVLLDGDVLGVSVSGHDVDVSDLDADFTVTGGVDTAQSAASVQHHFYVVWDWIEARWPSLSWLGSYVPATVELPGTCNAYYSGGTINFYQASPGYCVALGEIADVIYHEMGHGIHAYILAGGTYASDVSEGSSDFVAATILDDPVLAPGAWGAGTYIREIDTDKVYPDDLTGEVHNDGLIWASFLWDVRTLWKTEFGDTDGVVQTDELFLRALEQGPSLTDLYDAVMVADDDDGDLSNGTPDACDLIGLLNVHGLGPGPIGSVYLDIPSIEPQGSETDGYPVDVSLTNLTADCSGLDEDSVTLWYTIDGDLPAPTSSDPLTALSGWDSVALTPTDDTTWSAVIPRQPANAQVRYLVSMASIDGTQVVVSNDGDPDAVGSFWVGDRQDLWCEDFESGAKDWVHGTGLSSAGPPLRGAVDEWEIGTPTGEGAWDPPTAFDGASVAGIDLAGNYEPNTQLYLESPWIDLGDTGLMLLLSYQRWLTVEDARYDTAELSVGGTPVWENAATSEGTQQHLDMEWTHQDMALDGLVDDKGGVDLAWTLRSDAGLEYGGWHIDDVCVVQLDDPPAHYRRVGLQASDDDPKVVNLSWTDPWIQPLSGTILVARQDTWPTSPDDGRIIAVDFAPHWGDTHEAVDSYVLPGETWYYGLFAAGADGEDWTNEVVEGENGDIGGVAAEVTGDTGDTGDTGAASDGGSTDGGTASDGGGTTGTDTGTGGGGKDAGGCGCSGVPANSPAAWTLLLGLLGITRRRRGRHGGRDARSAGRG